MKKIKVNSSIDSSIDYSIDYNIDSSNLKDVKLITREHCFKQSSGVLSGGTKLIAYSLVLLFFVFILGCELFKKEVYFINIKEGDRLHSPFKVKFGVKGLKVDVAGEVKEGVGHHHILIDRPFYPRGEVIPTNKFYRHFGGGQEEAELELGPGEHTLTLQFADGIHRSYGKKLSSSIKVYVLKNE